MRKFSFKEKIAFEFILAQRRINYLSHICKRSDEELIKKVFMVQKETTTAGDFIKLVDKDFNKFELKHEEVAKGDLTKQQLRKIVRDVAFRQLKDIQSKRTKARTIRYQDYQMQEYLRNASINKEEMAMLTNMRSSCIKGIKANFKNMHKVCLHCPLECDTENPQEDTQEHILVCSRLDGSNMDPDFIQVWSRVNWQDSSVAS